MLTPIFRFLIFLFLYVYNIQSYTIEALADQVLELPGALSSLQSNQFSGYLHITPEKAIHYMYFESERSPETDSVIFWTNGGPGCSGLLGLYTEFGPWRAGSNKTLFRNPFAWTKYANIVFLEQPVGVGFSYADPPIADTGYNDYMAAKDNLLVLKTFFTKFPERASNGFYLASESYGGHYIPQWTLQVLGDSDCRENFLGFLVGNPFTSFGAGSLAMANALWGLQLVPKPLWDVFNEKDCQNLQNNAYDLIKLKPECFDILDTLFTFIDELNPYALDYPTCTTTTTTTINTPHYHTHTLHTPTLPIQLNAQAAVFLNMYTRMKKSDSYKAFKHTQTLNNHLKFASPTVNINHNGDNVHDTKRVHHSSTILSEESDFRYDACTQAYTVEYLNDPEVQEALHVRTIPSTPTTTTAARVWDFCSNTVNNAWAFNDYLADTTHLYRAIYTHPHKPERFQMLVYSGDVDGVCATVGTQHWIYDITDSAPVTLYQAWSYADTVYGVQQGGYLTQFAGGLSFLTVRYAGHEVPAYQPQKALHMLTSFLDASLFTF